MNGSLLIIFGFLLHLVLFYSIFDIYFTSPIIHGVPNHSNPLPPPAKRLVLFSADGLRADKLFELHADNISHTPYLRSVMEGRGRWGVSHTRVPTETRPGHVAIIAGFYEDVSAVAKGWKENPVEFDSVFNQSRTTIAWGSPDILPMFAKGSTGDHVITHTYPGESEDFASYDHTKLDTWVFENLEKFLKGPPSNTSLHQHLRATSGIIIFLHLLGLDTTGHVDKPYSQKYTRNLKVVDSGVKKVVGMIEDFFGNDGMTSYVFTSDHGMTDWGSHGAGDPSETETPILTWGAGIKKPSKRIGGDDDDDGGGRDSWDESMYERNDVNQADICPLMSILLGLPISLQSVGIVPVEILSGRMDFKAHSVLTNIKQLYEQYKAKMLEKKACTLSCFFSPYQRESYLELAIRKMELMTGTKEYEHVIAASKKLMEAILEGFHYYHNYERTQLGLCVCLSFIGWMLYIGTLLMEENDLLEGGVGSVMEGGVDAELNTRPQGYNTQQLHTTLHRSYQVEHLPQQHVDQSQQHRQQQQHPQQQKQQQHRQHPQQQQQHPQKQHPQQQQQQQHAATLIYIFSGLALLIIVSLYVQSRPPMHFIYFLSPLFLWYHVFSRRHLLLRMVDELRCGENLLFNLCILLCLEIMIFTFMYRELVTLLMLGMAVWANIYKERFFAVSCLLCSIFPLLPTVGKTNNYHLVYASCLVATIHFCVALRSSFRASESGCRTLKLQVLLIPSCGFIVWWFASERESLTSSSTFINMHAISWCILGSSFILPLFSPPSPTLRTLSLSIAFCGPHLLLSIAQESFFFLALCVLLYSWMRLETGKGDDESGEGDFRRGRWVERQRRLERGDVRRACFYILFLLLSFFGTGNIASINSFDPTSTLPFISVFNPFIMGGLCIFKIFVLLLLVSCFFHAIQVSINTPPNFLLLLIISDFMACHFFFMVRDSGSWLDIGTSISHYVIIMSFIIFLFVLLSLSKLLLHTHLDLQDCSAKLRSVFKWLKSIKNTFKWLKSIKNNAIPSKIK